MQQLRARVRATIDGETEPSAPPLRRVRTAPVPLVYDPVVATPVASADTAPLRRAALRRDRSVVPLVAVEALGPTIVASIPPTTASRSAITTGSTDARTAGLSEWEVLEQLILDERVRALSDRMMREARAQDPSDPLRATRARIA